MSRFESLAKRRFGEAVVGWPQKETVADPTAVARMVRQVMSLEQETFVIVLMNIRNKAIGAPFVIAMGSAHGVEVHPRDVFREAIRRNAAAIVLAHNHPSGDPTPSEEDVELTKRMISAGALVGIPVIDHIVIGARGRFVSMSETTKLF